MKTSPDKSQRKQAFLKNLIVYWKNGVALSRNIFAILCQYMAKCL